MKQAAIVSIPPFDSSGKICLTNVETAGGRNAKQKTIDLLPDSKNDFRRVYDSKRNLANHLSAGALRGIDTRSSMSLCGLQREQLLS